MTEFEDIKSGYRIDFVSILHDPFTCDFAVFFNVIVCWVVVYHLNLCSYLFSARFDLVCVFPFCGF